MKKQYICKFNKKRKGKHLIRPKDNINSGKTFLYAGVSQGGFDVARIGGGGFSGQFLSLVGGRGRVKKDFD